MFQKQNDKTARPFPRFQKLLPFGAVAAACLISGVSCSGKKELSLELRNGIKLEIVQTPDKIWWGKYEVTQEQWEAVVRHGNPVLYRDQTAPDKPVVNLKESDVAEFLHKLNALPSVKREGLVFRLPDRSEWEAACLAGSSGPWPLMADGTVGTLDRLGWYDGDWHESHAVGLKEPNAYGLYDMVGNVSERTTTDGVDRFGNPGKWFAGGDLSFEAPDFGEGARTGMSKEEQNPFDGFRVCAPAKGYVAPPKAQPVRDRPDPAWNGGDDDEEEEE